MLVGQRPLGDAAVLVDRVQETQGDPALRVDRLSVHGEFVVQGLVPPPRTRRDGRGMARPASVLIMNAIPFIP